jgi:hypothetical protein
MLQRIIFLTSNTIKILTTLIWLASWIVNFLSSQKKREKKKPRSFTMISLNQCFYWRKKSQNSEKQPKNCWIIKPESLKILLKKFSLFSTNIYSKGYFCIINILVWKICMFGYTQNVELRMIFVFFLIIFYKIFYYNTYVIDNLKKIIKSWACWTSKMEVSQPVQINEE